MMLNNFSLSFSNSQVLISVSNTLTYQTSIYSKTDFETSFYSHFVNKCI